jgi:hypothetical protein
MNLIEYLKWAKGEPQELPTSWKSYYPIQGCVDIGGLTLEELCSPIFEVDPLPPKRISDARLLDVWETYSKLPRQPDPHDVELLLQQIRKLRPIFPAFDLIYVAQAGSLARLSRFAEAEALLAEGFCNCSVKSALCETMGDVYFWQGENRSFGWYMQACHLGYESFAPYLLLSEAAALLGLEEIRVRLLNAVDSISSSLPRLPASSSTVSVVSKDKPRLIQAFRKFLEYANVYLPPMDAFPPLEDEKQRSIEAILVRGNPDEPPPSFRICSRAFARRGNTG